MGKPVPLLGLQEMLSTVLPMLRKRKNAGPSKSIVIRRPFGHPTKDNIGSVMRMKILMSSFDKKIKTYENQSIEKK
jgi:hypothetical protein